MIRYVNDTEFSFLRLCSLTVVHVYGFRLLQLVWHLISVNYHPLRLQKTFRTFIRSILFDFSIDDLFGC